MEASIKAYQQSHLNIYKKATAKWRKNHPKKVKEISLNRIVFLGEQITLKENPRKGICSNCGRSVKKGEIKQTQLHHEKYDKSDPLANTVELCVRCHNKQRISK